MEKYPKDPIEEGKPPLDLEDDGYYADDEDFFIDDLYPEDDPYDAEDADEILAEQMGFFYPMDDDDHSDDGWEPEDDYYDSIGFGFCGD